MTENKRFTITGNRGISDNHKKRLYDLSNFDGVISVYECLNELQEENKRLKSINQDYCNYIGDFEDDFIRLAEENKKLQERNNRQYKQLGDLYRLIEEKDWRALSNIMDDFKKAEEQLQKEWKCYE
jgi:predicted nuclease with TOPRIM domain